MRKSVYLIIQSVWSFILSSVVWYFGLKNASFDFYHNSDNELATMILLGGAAVLLVITVIYIMIGRKNVISWNRLMIIWSILVFAATAFLGLYGAAYGSEWINKLLN